ncbi:MAG TPA: ATP-binding protein, partial [Allocoleopsis sp.]
MITIIENEKPILKPCKMICDKPLHPKLDKYELTKLMNKHSTYLVIGKPGSGKTSLMHSLFSNSELFKKVFHEVRIIQPQSSRASMKDNIFDNIPEERYYDDLTLDILHDIYTEMEAEESEHPKKFNRCLIIDDMASKLKNHELSKFFYDLVIKRRHIGLT